MNKQDIKPIEKYLLKKTTGGKVDIFYVNGVRVKETVYNEICSKAISLSGTFPNTKVVIKNGKKITTRTIYIKIKSTNSNAHKLRSKKSLQTIESRLQEKVHILMEALDDLSKLNRQSIVSWHIIQTALNKVKEL